MRRFVALSLLMSAGFACTNVVQVRGAAYDAGTDSDHGDAAIAPATDGSPRGVADAGSQDDAVAARDGAEPPATWQWTALGDAGIDGASKYPFLFFVHVIPLDRYYLVASEQPEGGHKGALAAEYSAQEGGAGLVQDDFVGCGEERLGGFLITASPPGALDNFHPGDATVHGVASFNLYVVSFTLPVQEVDDYWCR